MLGARSQPRRIRRSEYDALARLGSFAGERVELIEGEILVRTPIGPPHADAVDLLGEALIERLGKRARVRTQQPFVASDFSEPEPDIAVVARQSCGDAHPSEAFLIVEVAESSLDDDRQVKAPVYARCGVPEYWIVDVAASTVEVYTQARAGRYEQMTVHHKGEPIRLVAFPDVELDPAAFLR